MALKQQIDKDLKAAMLSGDSQTVSVLRSLKSAILYAEVAAGARKQGLDDQATLAVLSKEAKKRQESADLYIQGGNKERADVELSEKTTIDKYLPKQLSEAELEVSVDKIIAEAGEVSLQDMGRIIGEVKVQTAGAADGSMIARLVKERLGE